MRIREAHALGGLDYFVVSCPKDLVMYSAAAESMGGVGFEVIELAVLIERAMRTGERRTRSVRPRRRQ